MKFFIDTANLAQIREANDLGVLDGVTTNPSLMAKEGIRGEDAVHAHYRAICQIVDGDVSAEVIATDYAGMVAEGRLLAALHANIARTARSFSRQAKPLSRRKQVPPMSAPSSAASTTWDPTDSP
jgi:hypothetical protein